MPLKNGTHLTANHLGKLAVALKSLAEQRVMVGIPADKAIRKAGDEGPINNAQLMAIHENGAPEANIPARPVVHPTVQEERHAIVRGLGMAGTQAMAGNPAGVSRQLNALGLHMQNAMRKKITDGPFVPLSPRTLAARKARGRQGEKPLIDTGQLRRALTYVIRAVHFAGKIFNLAR